MYTSPFALDWLATPAWQLAMWEDDTAHTSAQTIAHLRNGTAHYESEFWTMGEPIDTDDNTRPAPEDWSVPRKYVVYANGVIHNTYETPSSATRHANALIEAGTPEVYLDRVRLSQLQRHHDTDPDPARLGMCDACHEEYDLRDLSEPCSEGWTVCIKCETE